MEGREGEGSPGRCPAGRPYHLRNPLIECGSAAPGSAGFSQTWWRILATRSLTFAQETTRNEEEITELHKSEAGRRRSEVNPRWMFVS